MRYGILSDVHANIEALYAVFDYAQKKCLRIDNWWFLGDALGYGPDPGLTLEILRKKVRRHWIVGNHDAWIVGFTNRSLSSDAFETLRDHRERLKVEYPDLWEWCLKTWTTGTETEQYLRLRKLDCWLVHGALSENSAGDHLFQYVFPWSDDGLSYSEMMIKKLQEYRKRPSLPVLLLHGHTHIPYARAICKDGTVSNLLPVYYDEPIRLNLYDRIVICPGSVGQPRNPDPETHAAFGVLDTTTSDTKDITFQFHRATYNTYYTRQKMNKLNYELKLMQYLNGDNPDHPFRKDNPLWHDWNRHYQWHQGKGWEPILENNSV